MKRTPPLPLEDSLGFQVRDLNRLMQRALAARLARHGVAPGAWYVLRVLWEEDGLTQRELAARIGMQEPTAVIALRGMEEAGWITRPAARPTAARCMSTSPRPAARCARRCCPRRAP